MRIPLVGLILRVVVFLGMVAPEEDQAEEFCDRMERLVGSLQTVVFVESAGDMSLES